MEDSESFRIAHRQRAVQNLVEERKDGCIGADAERQRQHQKRIWLLSDEDDTELWSCRWKTVRAFGSRTGSERYRTWSRSEKMDVLAPMPSASDSTATAVNNGLRASVRRAKRRSCPMCAIHHSI